MHARAFSSLLWSGLLFATAPAAAAPLQELAQRHVGATQGVYAEAEDGTVLVEQMADVAVHPASVTKIATTLALLEKLGPDHRFETRVAARGPMHAGVLDGDLVVDAGLDPFLVSESAFLILCRLRALGVHRIAGRVALGGHLLFNWQPDPEARRFQAVLAGRDGATAWPAVAATHPDGCPPGLAAAALAFGGNHAVGGPPHALLAYRSPPLLHVAKVLNGFSNNVFHLVSPAIGGPAAVQAVSRAHVPEGWRDEIRIDNGAGAGTTNRLSPRATVAITRALAAWLAARAMDLTAVLPVSRIDPGTLRERPAGSPELRGVIVGKTGTYGSVGACALAGALRTRRFGVVTFAVLNKGLAVPVARARQDAFVRALAAATDAEPWPYEAPTRPDFLAARIE